MGFFSACRHGSPRAVRRQGDAFGVERHVLSVLRASAVFAGELLGLHFRFLHFSDVEGGLAAPSLLSPRDYAC